MILLGCLLAFSIAVAPRLVLILAWIFSDRWQIVWQNNFLLPLLGIIFLPFTTVMYMLAWSPAVAGGGNIEGWDWLWIILGLILDIGKWGQILTNRQEATAQVQKYYPSGAPRYGSSGGNQASISTGQVPPSTSPTADDSDAAPTAASTPADVPDEDKPGS